MSYASLTKSLLSRNPGGVKPCTEDTIRLVNSNDEQYWAKIYGVWAIWTVLPRIGFEPLPSLLHSCVIPLDYPLISIHNILYILRLSYFSLTYFIWLNVIFSPKKNFISWNIFSNLKIYKDQQIQSENFNNPHQICFKKSENLNIRPN